MSLMKSYAVFGLGRFGSALAKELAKNGAEVLVVDREMEKVEALVQDFVLCKCADFTDAAALEQMDVGSFDVVIVAVAGDLATSVMATALCKEAGVATVIAKAADEMQQKILQKVGADMVIIPEKEAGVRTAKNLISSGFVDMVELTKDVSMVDMTPRPEWVGKSLTELNLRKKYDVNVVAVKQGGTVSVSVDPEMPLAEGMHLIVLASRAKLEKIK